MFFVGSTICKYGVGAFGDFKDCYVFAHTPDKVANTEESVEQFPSDS